MTHDSADWARAIATLLPAIHEVDRNATRIWFRFHPMALADAFGQTDDPQKLKQTLRLDGDYLLGDQIDTSHWFLYGHRFWPHLKAAVVKRAESSRGVANSDLATIIRDIAKDVAAAVRAEDSLVIGIAAIGLMTLEQVGLTTFRQTPGAVNAPSGLASRSPARILDARRKDEAQGLAGVFRGREKAHYAATFDERRADGRFTVIRQTPITNGAARDTRDYSSGPRRCHEGPVPVECRTASCGTCWVGVLAGAEKLSDVEEQEAKLLKDCGYLTTVDTKPSIRLACKALVSGNVTIVIPTWNGFLVKGGLRGL
jgi:ferredoxin